MNERIENQILETNVILPIAFWRLRVGVVLKNNLEADEIIKFKFDFFSWKSTLSSSEVCVNCRKAPMLESLILHFYLEVPIP